MKRSYHLAALGAEMHLPRPGSRTGGRGQRIGPSPQRVDSVCRGPDRGKPLAPLAAPLRDGVRQPPRPPQLPGAGSLGLARGTGMTSPPAETGGRGRGIELPIPGSDPSLERKGGTLGTPPITAPTTTQQEGQGSGSSPTDQQVAWSPLLTSRAAGWHCGGPHWRRPWSLGPPGPWGQA